MKPADARRAAVRELADATREMERISRSLEETDAHRPALDRLAAAEQNARDAGVPWWRR